MKSRVFKIGVILILLGLVIFGMAVSIIELEKSNIRANEMKPIDLAVYNMSAVLIGIPTSLVGIAFVICSIVSRITPTYFVSLAVFFVIMWILIIVLRSS